MKMKMNNIEMKRCYNWNTDMLARIDVRQSFNVMIFRFKVG